MFYTSHNIYTKQRNWQLKLSKNKTHSNSDERKRELIPVGEDHPPTKTTKTEEKSPFVRYDSS